MNLRVWYSGEEWVIAETQGAREEMKCSDCVKQNGCTWQTHISGLGCRAWEGIPAEPCQDYVKKAAERARKVEELEIWRQAYIVVIGGRCVNLPASEAARFADKIADQALADYRAKREEMGI